MSGFMFNGHLRINLGKIALFSLKAMLAQPITTIWSFTQAGNLGITLPPPPPSRKSVTSVSAASFASGLARGAGLTAPVAAHPALLVASLQTLARPLPPSCLSAVHFPQGNTGQKVLRNQILFPVAPIVCGINK